jgi:hypothetical protein
MVACFSKFVFYKWVSFVYHYAAVHEMPHTCNAYDNSRHFYPEHYEEFRDFFDALPGGPEDADVGLG